MSTPCALYASTQAALRAASNPAPPRARSTIQRARNLGIDTSLFTPPSSTSSPPNPLGLITDSNVDRGDGHGHGWGRGRCYGRASTCAGCTDTSRRARAGWRQQRDREAQPAAAECAPQYECLRCSSALLPTPTPVHSTPTLADSTLRWIRRPTCAQSTAPSPRASHRAPAHGTPLRPCFCHITRRQHLSLALPALAFRLRARVHIRTTTRAQVPAGLAGAARPLRLDVPRLTSPPRIDARGVDVRAAPARLMESTQLAASAPSAGATEWGRHFQRAVASNSLDERLAPIRECPALPAATAHLRGARPPAAGAEPAPFPNLGRRFSAARADIGVTHHCRDASALVALRAAATRLLVSSPASRTTTRSSPLRSHRTVHTDEEILHVQDLRHTPFLPTTPSSELPIGSCWGRYSAAALRPYAIVPAHGSAIHSLMCGESHVPDLAVRLQLQLHVVPEAPAALGSTARRCPAPDSPATTRRLDAGGIDDPPLVNVPLDSTPVSAPVAPPRAAARTAAPPRLTLSSRKPMLSAPVTGWCKCSSPSRRDAACTLPIPLRPARRGAPPRFSTHECMSSPRLFSLSPDAAQSPPGPRSVEGTAHGREWAATIWTSSSLPSSTIPRLGTKKATAPPSTLPVRTARRTSSPGLSPADSGGRHQRERRARWATTSPRAHGTRSSFLILQRGSQRGGVQHGLLRALADTARGLYVKAALDSTSHLRPINGTLAPRVSPCARPRYTLTPALLPHRAPARLSLALPALAFRLRARVHIRTTTRAQVPAGLAGAARPLRLDVPRLTSPPRIDSQGVDVRAAPARLMESTQLAASAPSTGPHALPTPLARFRTTSLPTCTLPSHSIALICPPPATHPGTPRWDDVAIHMHWMLSSHLLPGDDSAAALHLLPYALLERSLHPHSS
ncbi:hypothetical protein B0H14DRAFT_3435164 [Mycena olivaceomarginata]|nr:hypothetical protein B0H14DRAFT_3435164 [Mycena olivaceomarginata]